MSTRAQMEPHLASRSFPEAAKFPGNQCPALMALDPSFPEDVSWGRPPGSVITSGCTGLRRC